MSRPSACVVNHDGEAKLSSCLDALLADAAVGRIVVIDNGSSDRSVALVRERYPTVEVIELPTNRGPARARNAGFRAIRDRRILFVDNDVVVRPGCAGRLERALDADEGAFVAMPRVRRARAPGTVDFEGADAHLLGQLIPRRAGESADDEPGGPHEAGSLISCCFLFDRERWGDGDPFDETFEFNLEDHEMGLRSRLLGHRLLVVAAAECLHGSGTPGASVRDGDPYPPTRVRSLIRGRWQVLATLYEARTLVVLAPLLALFEGAQLVVVARRGWLRHWLASAWWMLRHVPHLLEKRRQVQRARVVGDGNLLVAGPLPFRAELPSGDIEAKAVGALNLVVRAYGGVARPLLGTGRPELP